MSDAPGGRVLVVIPTYDEAAHLDSLLDAVMGIATNVSVLVVDDGSTDGTLEIAQRRMTGSRINLLAREVKGGLGKAYVDGFGWGLERGFTHFIEMDADLSHDPASLPELIEGAHTCGLVIGSRYISGGRVVGWSKGRHLLSQAGNLYARRMLGYKVQDSTSGFRCYRAEVLKAIGLDRVQSQGYAFQIEMTYKTWLLGHSIKEVPIVFRERTAGESKMSKAVVVEAITSITRWGIRDRLKNKGRR
ncbi:MAG: polyprenol monophosphomannose synthase [Actinomycetota bacterium]